MNLQTIKWTNINDSKFLPFYNKRDLWKILKHPDAFVSIILTDVYEKSHKYPNNLKNANIYMDESTIKISDISLITFIDTLAYILFEDLLNYKKDVLTIRISSSETTNVDIIKNNEIEELSFNFPKSHMNVVEYEIRSFFDIMGFRPDGCPYHGSNYIKTSYTFNWNKYIDSYSFDKYDLVDIKHVSPISCIEKIYKFYQKQEYTDFTFYTKNGTVCAHKIILNANGGNYFEPIFSDTTTTPYFSLEEIKLFLEYVYIGTLSENIDLGLLYELSQYFQQSELEYNILQRFNKSATVDNLPDINILLEKYPNKNLQNIADALKLFETN